MSSLQPLDDVKSGSEMSLFWLQVQGMSFIAAVLILNLEEADAFIAFANLLNKPCQMAFFRVDHELVLYLHTQRFIDAQIIYIILKECFRFKTSQALSTASFLLYS